MPRRAPTAARSTSTRRRATTLLTATAVVMLGSISTVASSAEDSTGPITRTISVTPQDQIEPVQVDDDELTTVILAGLDARAALDAKLPPPPPPPPPEPAPEPAPTASKPSEPAAAPAPSSGGAGVWDQLARCESGGNWSINTGNGYYGGLQFSLQSWRAVGGSGYPNEASKATQIEMGKRLQAIQGWGAWPACSRQIGLR